MFYLSCIQINFGIEINKFLLRMPTKTRSITQHSFSTAKVEQYVTEHVKANSAKC